MRSQWEKECEKLLFRYGRQVLGKDSGGMIVKLKQAFDIPGAGDWLELASEKADPREYIGAVLRNQKPKLPENVSEERFMELKARYDAKVARTA